MTGVIFLLIALGLSVAGTLVVMLRHRQPTAEHHGIEAFAREMDALAPQDGVDPARRPTRRRGGR